MTSLGGSGVQIAAGAARDHILLKFSHAASVEAREGVLAKIGGHVDRLIGTDSQGQLASVKLSEGVTVANAVHGASADQAVVYAEPDYIVHAAVLSNDPGYTAGRTWGMEGDQSTPVNQFGSGAAEAWAAGYTGSARVAVGVVDTGIDYTHPDLYLNVWLNNDEIPASFRSSLTDVNGDGSITFWDLNSSVNSAFVRDVNGTGYIDAGDLLNDSRWENRSDDDSNGYVDDLIGWDFANNDNDPFDDADHGTHVSGTIAASGGNGIGVAGVTWSTLIVPLKFLDASGSGYTSAAVAGINYFTMEASRSTNIDFVATNNSWGGGGASQSVLNAIVGGARQDILFIAAAGNGGNDGVGDNNDFVANYPSNYNTTAALGWDAVIAVSAINSNGALASYSNYGVKSVEIGAPGSSIYSTLPGGGYGYMSGTSMATPHVTGAIALLAAATHASAQTLRADLLAGGAATTSLATKTMTGDRLDVMSALQHAGSVTVSPPPPNPTPTSAIIYGTTGFDTVTGTASNDKLTGVAATGGSPGRGTIDTLIGNGGNDTFILGDSRGRFYDDGRARTDGRADYANITDFSSGDHLQLKGVATDYLLHAASLGSTLGTGVYYDQNHNHLLDSRDELIAFVAGSHAPVSADLLFV